MIRRLLVANRAEIASRVFRTCRDLGIETVAVHSDADAGLPYVREADGAVRLPGNTPADTYLRSDLLCDAARRSGADAVHPGYGFLSENPEFAEACAAAGIQFIGPEPEVMRQLGNKVSARELAEAAGVPVVPATGALPYDLAEAQRMAAAVGYPLMLKASHGGGGRGVRVVAAPSELGPLVHAARREAALAFGNDEVYVE